MQRPGGRRPEIRRLEEADLRELLPIEKTSFKNPWPRDVFLSELKNSLSYPFVLKSGGKVLGYIILCNQGETLHITNLAVHPERRREGLGGLLIEKAKDIAHSLGVPRMSLEVRRSNETAHQFYEKHGFKHIGLLKNYYWPDREHGLLYTLEFEEIRPSKF